MHRLLRATFIIGMFVLAACSGGDGGGGDGNPPPPTVGSLSVVNSTSYTITQLFVAPASSGTWGTDQLSSTIAPGGSFTLTDIPPGTYDFKAIASDGTTFWQTNSVGITAGGTFTWTLQPPAPAVGSVSVVNSTSFTITQLYVSPASAGTWGPDQLTSTIAPGGSFTLTNIPPGTYDFKGIASDGTTFWQTNSVTINAGATFTWTLLPPAPTVGSLRMENYHCNPIDQLYVAPAGSSSWGTDQLSGTIAANGNFTLSSIPAGLYDVKGVGIDGVYWTTYGISITSGATYTWSLYMPSGTGCLKVVNSSSYTIGYLYTPASPSGCTYDSWGPDQLGSQTIPPGYTFTLSNLEAGNHDIDADQLGGTIYWSRCSTPITAGGTYTWTLTN
jgi:hypothetical protein